MMTQAAAQDVTGPLPVASPPPKRSAQPEAVADLTERMSPEEHRDAGDRLWRESAGQKPSGAAAGEGRNGGADQHTAESRKRKKQPAASPRGGGRLVVGGRGAALVLLFCAAAGVVAGGGKGQGGRAGGCRAGHGNDYDSDAPAERPAGAEAAASPRPRPQGRGVGDVAGRVREGQRPGGPQHPGPRRTCQERFAPRTLNLNSKEATDAGLANLRGCKGLTDLWLLYGAGRHGRRAGRSQGAGGTAVLGLDATQQATDAGMPRLGG